MKLFYIALFGLLGVLARYYLSILVGKSVHSYFPLGTFLINMLGAFLIGMVYVLGNEHGLFSTELRLGLSIGFLGGFTTFSSYCIEAVTLFESGHSVYALAYLSLSPVCGFMSAVVGVTLARRFFA